MADLPHTPRLLVVSSRQEPLRHVVRILGESAREIDLRWASQPVLVPYRVRDLRPHLVLLFDDIGEERLIALIRRLASVTEATIVAVVGQDKADLARRAVFAGARGFFVGLPTAEQIEPLLVQATQGRARRRTPPKEPSDGAGRIIVFCAPKGGTGRTTLAVNSAIAIHALTGQSVVLVDADYAAPAIDVALDFRDAPNVSLLLPRLGRLDDEFLDAVLVTHPSGVRALLAAPPAENAAPRGVEEVHALLEAMRGAAAWVVVDLGLPLDERARAFITGADMVMVNVLPEAIGLRNARRLLAWVWEQGIPPDATRVILNRANMPSGLQPVEIREHLGIPVAFEVPDDQTLATASVNRGAPIVVDYRHTGVATAVRELCRRIVRDMTGAEPTVQADPPRRRRWVAVAAVVGALALLAGAVLSLGPWAGEFALAPAGVSTWTPAMALTATGTPGHASGDVGEAVAGVPRNGATDTETGNPPASDTPVATRTALPTRTRVPTRTPLPPASPAPTMPAVVVELPPPRLLEPVNGAEVDPGAPPVLLWSWSAVLTEDDYYVLTLAYRRQGATRYVDVPWTQETSLDATSHVGPVTLADEGRFYWSVKVVRRAGFDASGRPIGVPLSPMSEVRTFVWKGVIGTPVPGG